MKTRLPKVLLVALLGIVPAQSFAATFSQTFPEGTITYDANVKEHLARIAADDKSTLTYMAPSNEVRIKNSAIDASSYDEFKLHSPNFVLQVWNSQIKGNNIFLGDQAQVKNYNLTDPTKAASITAKNVTVGKGTITSSGSNGTKVKIDVEEVFSAGSSSGSLTNMDLSAKTIDIKAKRVASSNFKAENMSFEGVGANSPVTKSNFEATGSISLTNCNVTISEGYSLSAKSLEVTGGKLVNEGTITVGAAVMLASRSDAALMMLAGDGVSYDVVLNDADFDNRGTFTGSTLVEGGALTLAANSQSGDITMTSGEIYVTGADVETGSLTLTGGTINFSEGATVLLDENNTYDLSGATIVVTVDDVNNLGDSQLLFSGASAGSIEGLENVTVTFTDGTNPGVSGSLSVSDAGISVTTPAVPEPSTVTLSLLALSGLVARRRRK